MGADRDSEQPCPIQSQPLDSPSPLLCGRFEVILCIVSTRPTPPQVGLLGSRTMVPRVESAVQQDPWIPRDGARPPVPRHPDPPAELKPGWSLVIANVTLTESQEGPAFSPCGKLAASLLFTDCGRVRRFLSSSRLSGDQYIAHLESAHLPYLLRPLPSSRDFPSSKKSAICLSE